MPARLAWLCIALDKGPARNANIVSAPGKPSAQHLSRFANAVERVEGSAVGFASFVALLGSVIMFRVVLEELVTRPAELTPTLVFASNSLTFYLSAFLSATLLVTLLTGGRVEKASKSVLVAFIATSVAPIFDYFFTRAPFYNYIYNPSVSLSSPNWGYLLWAFARFGTGVSGVTVGIQTEVLVFAALATAYVYFKTSSIPRTIAAPFAVYALVLFYAGVPDYFSFGFEYQVFNAAHNGQYYSSIFAFLITAQGLAWLWLYHPGKFRGILRRLANQRSLHYLGLTAFGAYLGGAGWYPALLAMLCVLTLWFAASLVNDAMDLRGDELSKRANPMVDGTISAGELQGAALFGAMSALLVSAILGYAAFVIALTVLAVSEAYSVPPLRLKKFPGVSNALIAAGALLAFALGYLAGNVRVAIPTGLATAIFLGFALASSTKDLKDYHGDKATGVWTVPVLLGQRRGRVAVALLDFAGFGVVALILSPAKLLFPGLLLGAATVVFVVRGSREWVVFVPYFLFFVLVVALIYP